jgi:alpha-N-arabinofuranosidase
VQLSSQFGFFDNYTSDHPILIGEYAIVDYDHFNQSSPGWQQGATRAFTPFWYGTVAEAIFLLGAERNSDKIIGAAYAPGFQNWNRWEWIPDLISFDADPAHTTLSTSHHMLSLFSGTRITENLPMEGADFGPAYYVAGRSNVTGSHILKAAVYNSTGDVPFNVVFEGVGAGSTATLTYLTAPMNASQPIGGNIVETHVAQIGAASDGSFVFSLPEYSVAVLDVAGREKADSSHWKGCKDWKHSKHPW